MGQKYPDLYQLIEAEPGARAFYKALPDYVKDQMDARADKVNSYESLRDYVDNLTRGDG